MKILSTLLPISAGYSRANAEPIGVVGGEIGAGGFDGSEESEKFIFAIGGKVGKVGKVGNAVGIEMISSIQIVANGGKPRAVSVGDANWKLVITNGDDPFEAGAGRRGEEKKGLKMGVVQEDTPDFI